MRLSTKASVLFCFWLMICFCAPGLAQVAKLYPVDEAAKNPSFFAFRSQLLKAIQQKDIAALYRAVSPAIKNDFGGNDGIAAFKKVWKPEQPNSRIWSELGTVLALGGTFDGDTFMAPYPYSSFPDKFDAFEHGVVIAEGVRARQKPDLGAPVMTTLSFDIVKVFEWTPLEKQGTREGWIGVTLADGKSGYVAAEYIRSPIDYRAVFNKENGRWLMTALVAGD